MQALIDAIRTRKTETIQLIAMYNLERGGKEEGKFGNKLFYNESKTINATTFYNT